MGGADDSVRPFPGVHPGLSRKEAAAGHRRRRATASFRAGSRTKFGLTLSLDGFV